MREIVFDTETTGTNREEDRLIEIGMVETMDKVPTGEKFHVYINPERPVAPEAVKVHGITEAFLRDKPVLAEVVEEMIAFIGEDTPMVAHNAAFDRDFINNELKRLGYEPYPEARFVDTLKIAREKFPGARATLDALCKRFKVDATRRDKHGALLDAELLAEVYVNLTGGRQRSLELAGAPDDVAAGATPAQRTSSAAPRRMTVHRAQVSEAERARHRAFLDAAVNDPLWNRRGEDQSDSDEKQAA